MSFHVTLNDRDYEVESGTRLKYVLVRDALKQDCFDAPVEKIDELCRDCGYVAGLVDGYTVELSYRVISDCHAVPLTVEHAAGKQVVQSSAVCLMQSLLPQVAPGVSLEAGQSLDGNLFFEVGQCSDIAGLASKLDAAFQAAIEQDIPFSTRSVPISVASRLVGDVRGDKQQILRSWIGPRFGVVTIGEYHDLAYGAFVPSTAFLRGLRLVGIDEGLMLLLPPYVVPDKGMRTFVLSAARQAREWNRNMHVESVGQLNKCILSGKGQELIQIAETLHEIRIGHIAEAIAARPEVRVVFVSGPSSSGKTHTVRRLSTRLRAMGLETFYVGLDDYYRGRAECPRDESGEYDFEALEALDLERIAKDFSDLVAGKPTEIPRFNFVTQSRAPSDPERTVQIGPGQLLVIEGIHGLNPHITDVVPRNSRYGVYVSHMPQLSIDQSFRLPTNHSRLLRRIVRDRRSRGTTAADTIARWPSVRRGELKHIFPNQNRADSVFNSALAYELAVLRTFAWSALLEVPYDHPSYPKARDMLLLLSLVAPMQTEWIPQNSLLREFMGGSTYTY